MRDKGVIVHGGEGGRCFIEEWELCAEKKKAGGTLGRHKGVWTRVRRGEGSLSRG